MMEVFHLLGQYFDQDIFVIYSSVEEATAAFLKRLDQSEVIELSKFLETNLAAKSDTELADLWDETGSDMLVNDESAREFLIKILELTKKKL